MKIAVLYAYPPEPDGLSIQGHLLFRGFKENGIEVMPCHYSPSFQKQWIMDAFKPDVAVGIVKDATAETTDWRDKLIQFGSWALVVVFSLIAIILIVQMVKQGQAESAELLLNAGSKGAEACRNVCAEAINIASSGSNAP